MSKRMLVRWIALLATVACMTAIFLFSSQDTWKSNDISGGLLQSVFRRFFGGLPEDRFEAANWILRKCTHFGIYAGMTACAALCLSTFSGRLRWKFGLTVFISFLYAVLDEWHQTFVPGRTGSLRDVIIDTCGAALGAAVVFFITHCIRERKQSANGC